MLHKIKHHAKHYKRHYSIGTLVIILGLSVFFYINSGCGSNPTGGGGGGGGGGVIPQSGTISGHVYDQNKTTWTYTGTTDAYVTVSSEAMSMEVTATTDATGYYTITGLPAGATVMITATKEGRDPVTIVTNSSTANIIITSIFSSGDPGTATIRGTVEGITGSPGLNVYAYPLSGKAFHTSGVYYSASHTYQITGAPDDGDTYVVANINGTGLYAYNIVNTSGGGIHDCIITFESNTRTIEASLITPPDNYSVTWVGVWISKNNMYLAKVYGKAVTTGTTICTIEGLPPLKPGDYYCVVIGAKNGANEKLYKYFYGRSAGSGQIFDFSSPSLPAAFMKFPPDGITIAGTPTFEWNNISDASYYLLIVTGTSSNWFAFTNGTKISMPVDIVNSLTSGTYDWQVYAYKTPNFSGVHNMNADSPPSYSGYELDYELDSISGTFNR